MQDIAIFGAGGFGLEVLMLIEQINQSSEKWNPIGFFDDEATVGTLVNDLPVIGGIDHLNNWKHPLAVVVALGSASAKRSVLRKITLKNVIFPTLIHPSVIMGNPKFLQIGEGCIICAQTVITTNIKIGRFVTINLACTVGHETEIGDYSSFMPTVNISGDCKIGEANFWGTGAKVINGKTVGDDVTIGAGAVVITDIPSGVTAVGMPAKPLGAKKS